MEILEIEIEKISLDENNPRTSTPEQIDSYKRLFTRLGMIIPVILSYDNKVLYENGKFEAAQQLGFKKIKAVRIEKLTDEELNALRILEVKAQEQGQWNEKKLFEILSNMSEDLVTMIDIDMQALEEKIGMELDNLDEIKEVDTPEVEENYFSQQGDIYLLGNHRLMCGDSTKLEDVKKLMNGEIASLMVTDPPYNIDYESDSGVKIKNDNMQSSEFYSFLSKFYKNAFEVLEEGAAYYIFHADSEAIAFRKALEEAGFKLSQCLIWVKNSFNLSRQDYNWRHEPCLYGWKPGKSHFFVKDFTQDTVIEEIESLKKKSKEELIQYINSLREELEKSSTIIRENKPLKNDVHPTMKPLKLIARLMLNSSKNNQNVLDLFGGSGSTLITAEQLKRKAYLMEFDPQFVDVIVKRYKLLGKEDITLIRNGQEYNWQDIQENFK